MTNLKELLEKEIQDLFSSEAQLLDALPNLTASASHTALKVIFEGELNQTNIRMERLRMVASLLNCNAEGLKKCKSMQRILKETSKLAALYVDFQVKDAGLIGAMQRIIHFKIADYGTAKQYAEKLSLEEVARVLTQSLDEEKQADKVLSEIAINEVNALAIK
jgi:ferritin-like metal-binding protein YciE